MLYTAFCILIPRDQVNMPTWFPRRVSQTTIKHVGMTIKKRTLSSQPGPARAKARIHQ
jgi:hypothetical protein